MIGLSNIEKTSENKIAKCGLDEISVVACLRDDTYKKTKNVYVGGLIGCVNGKANINNTYLKSITQLWGKNYGDTTYTYVGGFVGCLGNCTTNLQYCVVGNIDALKYGDQSYHPKREKHSFIGKVQGEEPLISNCYVATNGNETGIEKGKITESDTITLQGANKLSNDVWCADEQQFPVLKEQQFKSNTAIQVVSDSGKRSFYYGEEFNIAGIIVEGQYASGDSFDVDTFEVVHTGYDCCTIGNHHTIIISAMGYQTTYNVEVRKINVVGLEVTALKENYFVGESPNIVDYSVKYILENGARINLSGEHLDYINYPTANIEISEKEYVLGDNKVSITCGELKSEIVVNAVEKTVVSIEITQEPENTIYSEGQKFSTEGMEITATYSDGSTEIVNNKDVEIIGETIRAGENIILLSYADYKVCSLRVTGEASPNSKKEDISNSWIGNHKVIFYVVIVIVACVIFFVVIKKIIDKKNKDKK